MNAGVSSEKEKVKESQSRSVTPSLDAHFGCRAGGVTSEATVVIGIDKTSHAIFDNTLNFREFIFHQSKTSKFESSQR